MSTLPALELLRNATVKDAFEMSRLHQACFSSAWSEKSFQELLESPGVTGLLVISSTESSCLDGMIVWRSAAEEAEILTFAVAKGKQRQGLGRFLLEECLNQLPFSITRIFIEVAISNDAALGLYNSFKFQQVGYREGYYISPDGKPLSAFVMEKRLASMKK